jgi:hypothetical protein
MKQYLNINSKQTTDNYPYGTLRAKAFFSVEFKPKKGFRSCFQTINPKNNRLNAEKHSTYSNFMLLYKNTDNNHIEFEHFSLDCDKAIQNVFETIYEHFDVINLTNDMLQFLCTVSVHSIRTGLVYTALNKEDKTEYYEKFYKTIIKKLMLLSIAENFTKNDFENIKFDFDAMKEFIKTHEKINIFA